jgi:hypothetical protein
MPRHRFQFRLRTLLIVVTIAAAGCAYLGHEWRIVQHRKALLKTTDCLWEPWSAEMRNPGGLGLRVPSEPPSIPFVRRLLGDEPIFFFGQFSNTSKDEVEELHAAFPEAEFGNVNL